MDWSDDTFEDLNGDLNGHEEGNFGGNLADFRPSQMGSFSPSGSSEDQIAQSEASSLLNATKNGSVNGKMELSDGDLPGSTGSSHQQQGEGGRSAKSQLIQQESKSQPLDSQENNNTNSNLVYKEVGGKNFSMEMGKIEQELGDGRRDTEDDSMHSDDALNTTGGSFPEMQIDSDPTLSTGGTQEPGEDEDAVDIGNSPRSSSRNSDHLRFDPLISEEELDLSVDATATQMLTASVGRQRTSPNHSRHSLNSTNTEEEVRTVLDAMMKEITGRQTPDLDSVVSSPLSDGGQRVIALAMEGLDVEIKQEPGTLTGDRQCRAGSDDSFVSTEMVGGSGSAYGSIPSTSRSPQTLQEENLLRSIGLRTRGVERNREVSEEIEAPRINPHQITGGSTRRRIVKKTGPFTLVKSSGISKKNAPGTTVARFSTALKRVCVVSTCEHYMKSPPNIYPFPNEKTRPLVRRKWVDAINGAKGATKKLLLGHLTKNAHFGVCLRHFNRLTDFKPGEKLLLLENAIPSFQGVPVSKKSNWEVSVAGTTAAVAKAQFARKTIVPVLKIASKAKANPIFDEIKEEGISKDVPEDDSDRDTNCEKNTEAKDKRLRRSTRKRPNPPSNSEFDDDDETDSEVEIALTGKAFPQKSKMLIANAGAGKSKVSVLAPKSRVIQPMVGKAPRAAAALPKVTLANVSNRSLAAAILAGNAAGKAPVLGKDASGTMQVMRKPSVATMSRLAPLPCVAVAGANGKDVRLVLQKISPLPLPPIILPPQIIMKSPPKILMANKMAQVEEGDLEGDSSDDEVQDILKEAQDEILELKFELEDARLDVAAEKRKVEHLETRVSAWIRAYFCSSTLEAERLEMMDKLASYYLEQAKKVDEEKKSLKAELELFRANYVRSQKETESYRQQIIELQGASSREIERIQTAKTKNEKDAQETITVLRRQLADAVMATEHARRGQKASDEDVRKLQHAATSAVGRGAQMVYSQPVTPSPPATSASRTRGRQKATPQYDINSPAGTSAHQQQAYFSSLQAESSSGKKRTRKPKDAPTAAEPSAKKPRESSVDRASLSGSGQSAAWTSAQHSLIDSSIFPSGLGYYLQPQQQSAHVQQDTRRGHETHSNSNLDQYSQQRAATDQSTFMPAQLLGPEFFQAQQSVVITSVTYQEEHIVDTHGGNSESPASRTRSRNQLQSAISSVQMTPTLHPPQRSFPPHFQSRNF